MKIKARMPYQELDGSIRIKDINVEDIMVQSHSILSIDGSTSKTGVGILRESDGALCYSLCFEREKDDGETPVQYKVRLKRAIKSIMEKNTLITKIFYEEPFVGHITSVANLMMLRTFVEEMIFENEPQFDYVKHKEINNLRWKKLFLAPTKVPSGTDNQKAAIKEKLLSFLPFLKDVTQDEIDAIAMGFVACVHIKDGTEDELQSKKRVHPFKYNIRFIGADEDEGMLDMFSNVYDGPSYLLENGLLLTDIKGTANFDKHVYQSMGTEDKVIIVKFDSDKHGHLTLKHRIGHLASTYPYLYAIIWRKTRK